MIIDNINTIAIIIVVLWALYVIVNFCKIGRWLIFGCPCCNKGIKRENMGEIVVGQNVIDKSKNAPPNVDILNNNQLLPTIYSDVPQKIKIIKYGDEVISDYFRFKSWDGSKWFAQIVNNIFHVRRKGSDKIDIRSSISILRFRSMEWQLAMTPEGKFLVFRMNGITGMELEALDLIDWDDEPITLIMVKN